MSTEPVTVVGAGMSGAACAATLSRAGVSVRIVDRGRAPGGRMASPEIAGRRVDIGAGYFTIRDPDFTVLVDDWRRRGLAREWTDTFGVLSRAENPTITSGPVRWATSAGLRSLVRDVLGDMEIEPRTSLDRLPDGDVVVAMPDPQAARLVAVPDAVDYDPVIAVTCGFDDRAALSSIPFADAAFVNDHPDVTFVADDGARRGDGAPVLVAHTTADRARAHLDQPDDAAGPVVDALRGILGVGDPAWTRAHRWTFAKPAGSHDTTHHLARTDGRWVALVGDQWSGPDPPRVESAWRSGVDAAHALLVRR